MKKINQTESENIRYSEALDLLSGAGRREWSATVKIGKWTVESYQDGEWNNDKYAKSWHRIYGGVFEINTRQLIFTKPHGRGKIKRVINLSGWRGDFLARAVIEAGLAPKESKYSLKIRINKAFDAKLLYTKRGYKFYSRTILDDHADYVIESPMGMIYHDDDKSKLIAGLHKKIRNQTLKLRGKLIDWKKCKALGFCDSGIKSFCDTFGFSIRGKYTTDQIEHAVRNNINAAAPFVRELKILSEAIGYKVAEFE